MATDEAAAFYNAVYAVVRQIPRGQVTTYGHVAKLIHRPRNSRQVGQALKFLRDESVPWQRVVNHKGIISPRDMPGAVDRQRIRLLEEGVVVEDVGMDAEFNGGGGGRVELALFGWFPDSVEVQQL